MVGFADRLIDRARAYQSRIVIGLDPDIGRFPEALQARLRLEPTEERLEETLFAFNRIVIAATESEAVAYKPQAAFYEQYGLAGIRALQRTLMLLRQKALLTILDAKRNDISHTAGAYATAYLAEKHPLFDQPNSWQVDAMTINGYLGSDGVRPFLACNADAGLFILAKTSNPSSGELQDLMLAEGGTVAEKMAALCQHWGEESVGQQGFSNVGLVVGATYPQVAARLRKIAPQAPFLMPGFGTQGGDLDAIVAGSDAKGMGAFAASSRGVLYPFQPEALADEQWSDLAMVQIGEAAKGLRLAVQEKLGG